MDTEANVEDVIGSLLLASALYYNWASSVVVVAKDLCKRSRKKYTERKYWVNPLNTVQKRREQGDHYNLIREMRQFDESRFVTHFRMTPKIYDKLLHLVSPLITKNNIGREPIDPGTRLEITLRFNLPTKANIMRALSSKHNVYLLRYLATGESCTSLANQFRVGRSTVPKIIDDTLPAIYEVLKNRVLMQPNRSDLLNIAEGFWKRWNFPNCVGAIDGKHIAIIAPDDCGSEYFNYKHYHSIILLAVCDYRYRFTMIDVGTPGRKSDAGVFRDTKIGRQFEEHWINLPDPARISEGGPFLPYFLVGDEGFGLKKYLQRPYPGRSRGNLPESQRIFNYRLSRARRVIENSFGILAAKWRIFRQPINAGVEKVKAITKAAICLHNFILMEESDLKPHQKTYLHPTMADRLENGIIVDGDWRKDNEPLSYNTYFNLENDENEDYDMEDSNDQDYEERVVTSPLDIRKELKEFFMTSGNVSWQFKQNIF